MNSLLFPILPMTRNTDQKKSFFMLFLLDVLVTGIQKELNQKINVSEVGLLLQLNLT